MLLATTILTAHTLTSIQGKKKMDLNNAPGKGLAKFTLIRLSQKFPELW